MQNGFEATGPGISRLGSLVRHGVTTLVLCALLTAACGPTVVADTVNNPVVGTDLIQTVGRYGEVTEARLAVANSGSEEVDIKIGATAAWLGAAPGSFDLQPDEATTVTVQLRCDRAGRVQHAWLLVDAGGPVQVVPVRHTCLDPGAATGGATEPQASDPPFGADDPLVLEPPVLRDAQVVRIDPDNGPFVVRLDISRDYLLVMPNVAVRRAVTIRGGRNVVMVGGEIAIPWKGESPTIAERRGLYVTGVTGTFHLEGVLLRGPDLSEGIQLSTPDAHVQITNVAVAEIRARDQVGFTDNHPDLIQSFGGARSITIDRFTGVTDYQGLFFQGHSPDDEYGPITLRRINIIARPTARYLLWFSIFDKGETVHLEDVWLAVSDERRGGLGKSVWPDVDGQFPRRAQVFDANGTPAVRWPPELIPTVTGYAVAGSPPEGDFVDSSLVGIGYVSPGYKIGSR